jgi:hypothetical protein
MPALVVVSSSLSTSKSDELRQTLNLIIRLRTVHDAKIDGILGSRRRLAFRSLIRFGRRASVSTPTCAIAFGTLFDEGVLIFCRM